MTDALKIFEQLARKQSPSVKLPPPAFTNISSRPLPSIDEWTLEVFCKANNPFDPIELRDLWVGRTEYLLGKKKKRPELAQKWKNATIKRTVSAEEVLCSKATIKFVKELFNFYFRDDLYGVLESDDHIILSSGAVCEDSWGMPEMLKACIRFALSKNWYGYSDSRGRDSARNAVAIFENSKLRADIYTKDSIVITLGATFAISSIADFILSSNLSATPALCSIPNYPPLVESVALRQPVQLVPMDDDGKYTSIKPLIDELRPDTPLVLL